MIFTILLQLVFALIVYKILRFQRKRVWNEDRSSYKLMPIKQCRMFWFLFFAAVLLPGLGALIILTFTIWISIAECDVIEQPKRPSVFTKIYNYLFKDLI